MLLTLLLLLLLLSSSCQLSFYTCSLQFRKTFRLFFSSPTILSCSSCLLTTSQLSTAVSNYSSDENALLFFILCFLSISLSLFPEEEKENFTSRQNATDILYRREGEEDDDDMAELLSSFSRSLRRIRLYHLFSFSCRRRCCFFFFIDERWKYARRSNTDLDVFSTAHNGTWGVFFVLFFSSVVDHP